MSVEPRPAQLPLPGGQAGSTVRVHPLLSAELLSPPGVLEAPEVRFARRIRGLELHRRKRDHWDWLPVPAFLVEHPTAGPLLVDTGLHPSVAVDPTENLGRVLGAGGGFRMDHDQALHQQLRARGVDPRDVRVVVMTHLHYDHASGVSEFPDATFVVDEAEWAAATAPRGLPRGYRTQQFDYGFDWRTVDFAGPEVDSFASFGRMLDLFGDGSVRLLSTPGHTLGHLSVLLALSAGREVLLTGDAVYTQRGINEDVPPLLLHDEHRYWRSLKEIRRFVAQTPSAIVIPGHDAATWPTLARVYE
jgi:glyoxylase-like metal-dependent hydrolase (beta-lactamase superfamily II)